MKQHKIFSSLVGGSLTAGFGGSIGLEAPIISTGSSMGSSLWQVLRLNYKTTTLLIGCGAAGAMASIIAKSKRNLFPVIDKDKKFLGLVILDDVREDMFNKNKYVIPIAHYIIQPMSNEIVFIDDSMESVMEKFKRTGNYNLVVLNRDKYEGFVSRANVFNAYRQTLIDVSHE